MTVTCFCATRNRRGWLPHAIKDFQRQTYEDRRMLIVADGEDIRDLVPNDDRISLVSLTESERPRFLGEKFNLCCRLAQTEILAKWDDDDYGAPERLADQMQRLRESGKQLTGYRDMLFTDGRGWWKYFGTPNFCMGNSLLFRREWWEKHPFRSNQHVGSDVMFQAEAGNHAVSVDAGELMVASIHPNNTSPRNLGSPYKKLTDYAGPARWSFPVAA